MSSLGKLADIALESILAILRHLPRRQQQLVLDEAWERLQYDEAGDAKLAARKKARRKSS